VLFSFGVWRGMLDSFTPLGQDTLCGLVVGMGRCFGDSFTIQTQQEFLTAGEHLYVNITGLILNPLGRRVLSVFIPAVDPLSGDTLQSLFEDESLRVQNSGMNMRARLRFVRGVAPLIANVIFNLLWPERGRARLEHKIEIAIESIRVRCTDATPAEVATIFEETSLRWPPVLLLPLVAVVAAGQIPLQILLRLAAAVP